jgi:hypothetical protein
VDVDIEGEMGNYLRAVSVTLTSAGNSATYSLDRDSYEEVPFN